MRASLSILRNDLAILRQDAFAFIILIVIPIILVAFIKPTMQVVLRAEGYSQANGAEQALPGALVMFAFFAIVYGAEAVFREHRWNTWIRLRAAPISSSSIVVAKAATPLLLVLGQEIVLLIVGGLIFRLAIRGPIAGVILVSVAFAMAVAGLSLVIVAFCRNYQQAVALGNLAAIVLGGLGGALTPSQTLPAWIRPLGNATPSYWAMRGYRAVILQSGGMSDAVVSVIVLLAIAVVLLAIGCWRFSMGEAKNAKAL